MKLAVILYICASVDALHVRTMPDSVANAQKEFAAMGKMAPVQGTLRQWLSDGRPFNMVLTPQYNNQHSMFGVVEFLRKENLFRHMGGVSAGSGGTLPGAFAAAGATFDSFWKHFPREGWGGLGPSEPKITMDYEKFLDATLPGTFEELKYPFGISLTHWDDTESLKKYDHRRQRGFGVSTGDLHEAMLAAVTTSGTDSSCPNCTKGFWPRRIHGKYPVTDGAFGDIWGVKGLSAIPHSDKILHLLPLDYPGQVEPPPLTELPKTPQEMVSIVIVQPPIASHGYILEQKPWYKLVSHKTSEEWNTLMFETTHHAMPTALNQKLEFGMDSSGRKSATVILDHGRLTDHETMPEQVYDRVLALERDRFWAFYGADGKGAWGDMTKTLLINQKLRRKHVQRLFKDIVSGGFGPRFGSGSTWNPYVTQQSAKR